MPELRIAPEILENYTIIDVNGEQIGSVDRVWVDASGDNPQFLGVQTGMTRRKTRVVPAANIELDGEHRAIYVPYRNEHVTDGPTVDPDGDLTDEVQRAILDYYSHQDPQRTSPERDMREHFIG